ncbi:hypothetical protein SFIMM107S_05115 [Streptomyces griseus]
MGAVISEPAVAAVRPSTASGVSRCTAVIAAISTHGSPHPIAALAARATASGDTVRAPTPSANSAIPPAANTRSGSRRSNGPTSSPTATEPAPCTAYSTPAYAGPRPSTSSTYAKVTAPFTPASSIVAAPAATSGRSTAEARIRRSPTASSPRRAPAGAGSRSGLRTGRRAKTRAARAQVAASSRATAGPPNRVYRPAPASGATSFMPSLAVIRSPLKSASSEAGTVRATSAASAASRSTPAAP